MYGQTPKHDVLTSDIKEEMQRNPEFQHDVTQERPEGASVCVCVRRCRVSGMSSAVETAEGRWSVVVCVLAWKPTNRDDDALATSCGKSGVWFFVIG